MIYLTHFDIFPPAGAVAGLTTYDSQRPDGLTKELIARVAALGLVKGAGDAAALAQLHDLLDPAVTAAVGGGTGVVNPVVKRIVSIDALNVPTGQSESDATAAIAGAVYDVSLNRPLTVVLPEPVPTSGPSASAGGPTQVPLDLTGLDLLGPEFEPLRVVLTRTLMDVRPDLYAAYRKAKDAGTADSREQAYRYVFSVLAVLTQQTFGPGAHGG